MSFSSMHAYRQLAILLPLLLLPQNAQAGAKQRGAALYADNGCAHCHGPAGVGTQRAPELLHVKKRMTENAMQQQILQGGRSMPPFGTMLDPKQVHDLIAYLRSNRKPPAAPPTSTAEASR